MYTIERLSIVMQGVEKCTNRIGYALFCSDLQGFEYEKTWLSTASLNVDGRDTLLETKGKQCQYLILVIYEN